MMIRWDRFCAPAKWEDYRPDFCWCNAEGSFDTGVAVCKLPDRLHCNVEDCWRVPGSCKRPSSSHLPPTRSASRGSKYGPLVSRPCTLSDPARVGIRSGLCRLLSLRRSRTLNEKTIEETFPMPWITIFVFRLKQIVRKNNRNTVINIKIYRIMQQCMCKIQLQPAITLDCRGKPLTNRHSERKIKKKSYLSTICILVVKYNGMHI